MGFYFRKSLGILGNLLKLNFSKSGIGISTGVKGARLVFGPAGTYVHLGRNGFYYRKYLGKGASKRKSQNDNKQYQELGLSDIPVSHITQNFDKITDSESQEFITEVQKKANKVDLIHVLGSYPLLIVVPLFFYFGILFFKEREKKVSEDVYENVTTISNSIANLRNQPSTSNSDVVYQARRGEKFLFLDSAEGNWIKVLRRPGDTLYVHKNLAGTVKVKTGTNQRIEKNPEADTKLYFLAGGGVLYVFWIFFLGYLDKRRKSVNLIYEKDDLLSEIESQIQSSFDDFMSSQGKWQIITSQKSLDLKYSSGAGTMVNRKLIKGYSSNEMPFKYFKTNVKVPVIKLMTTQLFFFPDILLLKRGNELAGLQYDNIILESGMTRFVESDRLLSDANEIDFTFQYVNKDGGPDRRFSNNRRLPVCLYSQYSIASGNGFNAFIMTSKQGAMDSFFEVLRMLAKIEASEDKIDEILNNGNF
ncbi:DUF4236 domain-containing protein [Muriicola marianensis]|uniref:DUF4236 domain-containing protein n=1 Tax=Muriicola marianensis TaxID=1324801 RepID=A0ABQ1QTT8_9FLAO|nr:DUF4236 domain-containing protein [Muriicola marianensis]GGD45909.1 hypothetical protein GCM10011361_11100 [Muriicola marianensis]